MVKLSTLDILGLIWLIKVLENEEKLIHPISVLLLLSSGDLQRNIESCSLGGMDDHDHSNCSLD